MSVKGVLLSRTPEGPKLLRVATAIVPPEAAAAQRAQAIQQVMQSLKETHESRIITAVGGSNVVLRSVLLPKMSPQELKTALTFEAEKYIPFKLEETILDFAIVGDRPEGRMEVLLAAARQELISAHLGLLQSAGVSPYAIDLEALALSNAWGLTHPKEEPLSAGADTSGLIHVGARGTILVFLIGSQLQFTREVSLGGNTFTQAVAEGLQLDALQAEAIKCQPGLKLAQVRAALQPAWEEWLTQCRVSFDFYENQFGHRFQRIILSGGSTRLVGFKEWILEELGIPTEEWNPMEALASDIDPKLLDSHRNDLGVAIGLAVRELL